MIRLRAIWLLPIVCILFSGASNAQDYTKEREKVVNEQLNTRAQINSLSARIKSFENRIGIANEEYDKVRAEFDRLQKLIALQDEKLKKLDFEQTQIQAEINLTAAQINKQEQDLKRLIDNYKSILTFAYKNGRKSNMELLLTSSSINQMLVRSFYLQKFEEQRVKQAEQIRQTRSELEFNQSSLVNIRDRNNSVLAEIQTEKQKYDQQGKQQERNVSILQRDRRALLDEVRKDREKLEGLENTMSSLIADEARLREAEAERLRNLAAAQQIEDAEERANEVAKYSEPVARDVLVLDENLLENHGSSFAQQRGSLPWPVDDGVVSVKFGRQRHPIYGTLTENPGVEITTPPAQPVRVVNDGYVYAFQPVSGYGDVVFVQHGNYFTAYGNMSRIDIQKGDLLKRGDVIGLSGTENSILGESIFFMINEVRSDASINQINPETWLRKK